MGLVFDDVWKDTAKRIEEWVTFPWPFEVLEGPIEMLGKAVAYPFCWIIVTVGNGLEVFLNTINTNLAKVAPDAIKGLQNFIKDPAGTIVKGFQGVISGIQGFISDEKGPLKTWIDGAGSWVWTHIKDPAAGLPKWLDLTKIDLMDLLNPRFDGMPKLIASWFEPKIAEGLETLNEALKKELVSSEEGA